MSQTKKCYNFCVVLDQEKPMIFSKRSKDRISTIVNNF